MMLQALLSEDCSRAACCGRLFWATTWTLATKVDSSRNSGTESQPFICPAMPQKTHAETAAEPESHPQILPRNHKEKHRPGTWGRLGVTPTLDIGDCQRKRTRVF